MEQEPPGDVEPPVEKEDSAQYALIARYKKAHEARRSLSSDSVVVQSWKLKRWLGVVLFAYSGITPASKSLELKHPFTPLLHRWSVFQHLRYRLQLDSTEKKHVEMFCTLIEEEMSDVLARREDLVQNGVIAHDLLWAIFELRSTMSEISGSRIRGIELLSIELDSFTKTWLIETEVVDIDCPDFGYRNVYFSVDYFSGSTPIESLPARISASVSQQ